MIRRPDVQAHPPIFEVPDARFFPCLSLSYFYYTGTVEKVCKKSHKNAGKRLLQISVLSGNFNNKTFSNKFNCFYVYI
jgi:hypothetical protein